MTECQPFHFLLANEDELLDLHQMIAITLSESHAATKNARVPAIACRVFSPATKGHEHSCQAWPWKHCKITPTTDPEETDLECLRTE